MCGDIKTPHMYAEPTPHTREVTSQVHADHYKPHTYTSLTPYTRVRVYTGMVQQTITTTTGREATAKQYLDSNLATVTPLTGSDSRRGDSGNETTRPTGTQVKPGLQWALSNMLIGYTCPHERAHQIVLYKTYMHIQHEPQPKTVNPTVAIIISSPQLSLPRSEKYLVGILPCSNVTRSSDPPAQPVTRRCTQHTQST